MNAHVKQICNKTFIIVSLIAECFLIFSTNYQSSLAMISSNFEMELPEMHLLIAIK